MSQKKNSKKGVLLPPAVGYSFHIVLKLISDNKINFKYYLRTIIILIVNLINFPFRTYERLFINPRFKNINIEKDPIFILGHWRSGTTHLHNVLSQDSQMAYTTTYQSVFPDTLFNKLGRLLFKGFATLLIPGKRAGDNVTLGSSLPQEEEFALGDKTPISFYYFWMFPTKIPEYYQRFIRFSGIKEKQLDKWKNEYKLLIKKAIKNTNKERFLSKNPPNTGRVKELLQMFPNARFIHIHRNPVEVFLSTQNFFNKMMPHLQLQNISKEVVDNHIVQVYKDLMSDYLEQRDLIPKNHLVEIKFDEFEINPIDEVKRIYSDLGINGYQEALPNIEAYLSSMKSYKKNTHTIKESQMNVLKNEWRFSMEEWNYVIPNNISIVKDE
ncbi:sulfotransferase family protein [Bizionia arctica]|uniref:Sulfotransferase family protein n=1 Tax=Bizionia arctica TaxID=1495645 RepID=A0A917GVI3_9FLAO|nr:sulfotransferase [Bizionia arctica]GGG58131.1 sulfotransferase family protein [Bizionia arctica]